MTLYYGNRDWAQMLKHADSFVLTQGTADPKAKSQPVHARHGSCQTVGKHRQGELNMQTGR